MRAYYKVLLVFSILLVVMITIELAVSPPVSDGDIRQAGTYLSTQDLPKPPRAFHHDGCTLSPDRFLGHDLREACLNHDIAYWAGGEIGLRKAADLEFKEAITHTGPLGKPLGVMYYLGVRLFGDRPITRLVDANWGYGWND